LNQRKARLEPAKHPSLTLGYLGRIEPNKGMTELLAALKKLKAEGIKFKVRFAGKEQTEGEYLPKFKEALGDDFEYCGLVSGETKREFLGSLDVFVMPTYFEGLPMSLLETMGYGVVPVVTQVGSIPTVVKDGENGLFVKVKDVDSICEALKKLDDDRSLLAKMSDEARKTIQENFSATKYVERLNEIYAGL
jgi:glycosyltransferase involved in cell wall biosynthesis